MPAVVPDPSHRYTVKEVLAFPDDGNRYELVDGVLLVSPSPRLLHQGVLRELYVDLANYLRAHNAGRTVFASPADITWGPNTLVQPDLFVVHAEEISSDWRTIQHLRFAIEVISRSTARHDRFVKRVAYQKHGVETYWIVDPYQEHVEVWTPTAEAPVVHTDRVTWHHTPEAEAFVVDLHRLWEQAAP